MVLYWASKVALARRVSPTCERGCPRPFFAGASNRPHSDATSVQYHSGLSSQVNVALPTAGTPPQSKHAAVPLSNSMAHAPTPINIPAKTAMSGKWPTTSTCPAFNPSIIFNTNSGRRESGANASHTTNFPFSASASTVLPFVAPGARGCTPARRRNSRASPTRRTSARPWPARIRSAADPHRRGRRDLRPIRLRHGERAQFSPRSPESLVHRIHLRNGLAVGRVLPRIVFCCIHDLCRTPHAP